LGFDFIATYNDMAYKEGQLVSPQVLREVFLPKMKIVAEAIKLPWAFHSDGNLTIVMEDLLTLGMNCANPFEPPCMELKVAKEKWGDRICLWGNIDLVKTLPYGTVEEVEAEVKQRNYGKIAKKKSTKGKLPKNPPELVSPQPPVRGDLQTAM